MIEQIPVSIIIPVHNTSKYLPGLFKSLEQQNQGVFEVIFVDDGSTDNSIILLEAYNRTHMNCKLIQQINCGAPVARNKGLNAANGKYIWFFDSDDTFIENVIAYAISKIEETQADILIGNMRKINKRGTGILARPLIKNEITYDNKKLFFIDGYPGNKIFKKSIIDFFGIYFADVKIIQDVNFFLKYAAHCKKICFIESCLYNYLVRENGISGSNQTYIYQVINSMKDVKQHYKIYGLYKDYKPLIEYDLIRFMTYQFPKLSKIHGLRNRLIIWMYFRKTLKKLAIDSNPYISDILKRQLNDFLEYKF